MNYGVPGARSGQGAEVPVCPRHPDRAAYVRCQRCGRPACTECQRPTAVGVQCVDCVQEAHQRLPRQRIVFGTVGREGRPVVTYTLIAICVVVFLFEWVPGLNLERSLMYVPLFTEFEPWRMLTSVFAHSTSFFGHILFNMWALYVLGQFLEPVFGRVRFLALFLLSGFAGSVGVLLIAPVDQGVVGASGAVFGLFGAVLVLQLKKRGGLRPILLILGLNAVLGFLIPGIAWQAHLGGFIAGALLALVFIYAPGGRKIYQVAGVVAISLLLVVLTVWRTSVLHDSVIAPLFG